MPISFTKEDVDAIARRPFQSTIQKGRIQVKRLRYFSHALKAIEESFGGKVVVLLDELDLDYALIESPIEKGVLIRADSTDPEYTKGLTIWEHEEALKILDQQTKADILAVGKYTPLLARAKLLQQLKEDSKLAKSKFAKVKRGKGQASHAKTDGGDLPMNAQPLPEDRTVTDSEISQDFPSEVYPGSQSLMKEEQAIGENGSSNGRVGKNIASEMTLYTLE